MIFEKVSEISSVSSLSTDATSNSAIESQSTFSRHCIMKKKHNSHSSGKNLTRSDDSTSPDSFNCLINNLYPGNSSSSKGFYCSPYDNKVTSKEMFNSAYFYKSSSKDNRFSRKDNFQQKKIDLSLVDKTSVSESDSSAHRRSSDTKETSASRNNSKDSNISAIISKHFPGETHSSADGNSNSSDEIPSLCDNIASPSESKSPSEESISSPRCSNSSADTKSNLNNANVDTQNETKSISYDNKIDSDDTLSSASPSYNSLSVPDTSAHESKSNKLIPIGLEKTDDRKDTKVTKVPELTEEPEVTMKPVIPKKCIISEVASCAPPPSPSPAVEPQSCGDCGILNKITLEDKCLDCTISCTKYDGLSKHKYPKKTNLTSFMPGYTFIMICDYYL